MSGYTQSEATPSESSGGDFPGARQTDDVDGVDPPGFTMRPGLSAEGVDTAGLASLSIRDVTEKTDLSSPQSQTTDDDGMITVRAHNKVRPFLLTRVLF